LRFAGKTDKGLARSQNEDAFIILGGQGGAPLLMAVADGMGGHRAGDVASRMAIEAIAEAVGDAPGKALEGGAKESLLQIMRKANDRIFVKSQSDPSCEGMGTTLSIAAFVDGRMVVAHVGDSCVYFFRDRALKKITIDHTYVEELVKIGSLTREEARTHPRRNYITKAVGCSGKVEADVYEEDVRPGDRVILCSDGLSKMLTDQEMVEMVYQSDDPDAICGVLIEKSNARGGLDNITALVFLNIDAALAAGKMDDEG